MADKLIVIPLFSGPSYATSLWLSQEVLDDFLAFKENEAKLKKSEMGYVLAKLEHYCKAGFRNYEGNHGEPIRAESRGTHRIGHVKSLYRIYGFYETDSKRDFIAIATNLKTGRKLSKPDRELLRYVADIKESGRWEKEK